MELNVLPLIYNKKERKNVRFTLKLGHHEKKHRLIPVLFSCQTRKDLIIIRALARAILPAIVQLFETEEGQKGFEKWRKERRKQKERQLNNKINNDNLAHI